MAMLEAAFWGLVAASSLLVGMAAAVVVKPPPRTVGLALGFGSGALIAAVAFELVAEVMAHDHGAAAGAAGLALGATAFYLGDLKVDRMGGGNRKDLDPAAARTHPGALVLGTILDGVPESVVIGAGLALNPGVSLAMVTATFLSNMPEALGATAGLTARGVSAGRVLAMWVGIALLSAAAAAFGYAMLDALPPETGLLLNAFASGAILTMLADAMMPEAFEHGGPVVGLFTTLGFAVATWLAFLS